MGLKIQRTRKQRIKDINSRKMGLTVQGTREHRIKDTRDEKI